MRRVTGLGGLWRPFLGVFLGQTAVYLARPVVSYRALDLGAGEFGVGLLVAVYAFLPLLCAVTLGRLAGAFRFSGMLPGLGSVLLAGGCVLSAAAGDLTSLAIGSALMGLGNICVTLGSQAWVSRAAGPEKFDVGFGWVTAGMSLGQAVGPLIAGTVGGGGAIPTSESLQAAFWIASGIALLALVCFVSRSTGIGADDEAGEARLSALGILRRPGVAPVMLVGVVLLTTTDLLGAYLPVIAQSTGIPAFVVGALLAVRGAASTIARFLIGPLTRRWSRMTLLIASTLGAAATMAVVGVTHIVVVLFVVLAVGGFLLGIGTPLSISVVAIAVPARARSSALAVRLFGNRLAQVVLPPAAGALAASLGIGAAFMLQAGLLVVAAVWTRLALHSRE